LKGHTGVVSSVAFSPDGTRIVIGSQDLTAKPIYHQSRDQNGGIIGRAATPARHSVPALSD
jgi:hypothetical protein